MEISKYISEKVFNINDLNFEDIEQLQLLILDFIAALFAGYKQNEIFNKQVEEVIFQQGGTEESSVFFQKRKYPARLAAFMNSLYGHGAELDDGNKKAMGHVGVHVIPAVLALAESEKKSEIEVLRAIVAGYEVYIRISSAAQPGMINRSFHSTGMAGAPACAAACAKLLNLDADGIESAMSLACTMSSGLLTYSESRQMIKPINPAKAAETGVFAAKLVKAGVTGPLNCFEGPNGWFRATTDIVDTNMITDNNNGKFLIHNCYFKLYPSCRHTHCGIEAAIQIYNRIDYRKINKVYVYIYPNAIKLAGQITKPNDADETKFSIAYTLACALRFGEYSVDYMHPDIYYDELIDIIDKIELIPDESMEDKDKGIRGTRIKVILDNNNIIENEVLVPKGDPENPLNKYDLIKKFMVCSEGLLNETQRNNLIDYIFSIKSKQLINTSILFAKED